MRSGARAGARSPSARWRCLCSAWRSTSASTRPSTTAPRPTRPTRRARPPPTPRSRSATSSGPTAWWRSSSTATTACCAGRRCSRWPSPDSGFCGARAATGSPAPSLPCARSSSPPDCARPRWGPSSWWPACSPPRCSGSGSRRGTCWPPCRWPRRWWRGGCAAPRAWAARSCCSRWRRRPGSTWTCAGAAARSSPTAPTLRSDRSPARSRTSVPTAGGRSGWRGR
ncbi:MAG: hypothetical protein QOH58_2413 [Thermoleophilaceae bacterium]|nr:hypothetical protein [Thermoleophilaceae bacterium]